MSLAEVSIVWDVASCVTATRELVEEPTVEAFVKAVRAVDKEVKRRGPDDDLLASLSRAVRRARWDLHSLPLPVSAPTVGASKHARAIRKIAVTVRAAYGGDLSARADAVADLLDTMAMMPNAPLGERVVEILATGDHRRSAVLVRRGETTAIIRAWLRKAGCDVNVLSQEELTHARPVETLVVTGPTRWYERNLTAAPRAEQLAFVHYKWISDDQSTSGLLSAGTSSRVVQPIRSAGRAPAATFVEDADEFIPQVDWSRIAAAADRDRSELEHEIVHANAFSLGGGYLVYLEAGEGPTILVVDLEAEASFRVRSEPTRSVGRGTYVLLRSAQGSEDYIRSVANQLLGRQAAGLRSRQSEWKSALRARVVERGSFQAVRRDLEALGTRVQNVSYWVSFENIRTMYFTDFEILMRYVGLDGRAEEIWTAMGVIKDAHTKAGSRIRGLLEAQILDSDLTDLRRNGWIDFELQGVDAGTLSIFRVDAKSPEPVAVSTSWLRWPWKMKGDEWLG